MKEVGWGVRQLLPGLPPRLCGWNGNGHHWPTVSGTIKRCDLAEMGVVVLEEVCH